MTINYIEPGTYITEVFKPQAVVPPGLGLNLVIVGIGSIEKTVVDEAVTRGGIYDEILTVDPTPGSHTADLLNLSDQRKDNTIVYKDGNAIPFSGYDFVDADTIIIDDVYYDAGSAYKTDYVATDSYVDDLAFEANSIDKIGLFAGSSNYKENTDFELDTGDVAWDILTSASFTGLESEDFDLSVNDEIKLSMDGKPFVTATITGSVQTAVTAAEVAADINAALVADINYGSNYSAVASDVAGKVKLTSPGLDPYVGFNSIVNLFTSTNSALEIIFGLTDIGAPYEYRGTGKRPLAGQTYYVSYKASRDSSEYNVVREFISDIDFYNDIGLPADGNDLANAGSLAWSRGVLNLFLVQVKDADSDGIYLDSDYVVALDALVDERLATDIVVLKSSATIRAKVRDIVKMRVLRLNPIIRDIGVGCLEGL